MVACADDIHVLQAVKRAEQNGFVYPVLCGDRDKIVRTFTKDIYFTEENIFNMADIDQIVKLVSEYTKENVPCALMKGNVTTAELMREVIKKDYGLRTERIVSHVALFENPNYHKLFVVTDSAMNIAPKLGKKVQILQNAVDFLLQLGIEQPKVACITALETINKSIEATLDAYELTELNKSGEIKNCIVEGPLAFDNAISKAAARRKGIKGEVAGDPDILLVPEINAGNILYKSLNFLGNSKCAGIITGAKIPLVITSRTDSVDNKYYSIVLACIHH